MELINEQVLAIQKLIGGFLSDIRDQNDKIIELLEFIVKEIKEENGKDL